jgi:hypothetical protein
MPDCITGGISGIILSDLQVTGGSTVSANF